MHNGPPDIIRLFEEKFHFPKNPLFGSVATAKKGGMNCRTMRIYDLDEKGRLILLSHTEANKWRELSANPEVAICIVSEDKLTQLIASGRAVLETKKQAPEKAAHYWSWIREDVKNLYDPAYAPDQTYSEHFPLEAPQEVPESSGIITIQPDFWESLELVVPYTESRRFHYNLSPSGWTKSRINLG